MLSSSTPNTPPPSGRRSTTSTLPPLSPAVCQMDRRAGSSCPSSFQPSQAGPSGAASCLQARGRARRGGEQWHPLATRMLLRPPQPSPQLPAPTTQGRATRSTAPRRRPNRSTSSGRSPRQDDDETRALGPPSTACSGRVLPARARGFSRVSRRVDHHTRTGALSAPIALTTFRYVKKTTKERVF